MVAPMPNGSSQRSPWCLEARRDNAVRAVEQVVDSESGALIMTAIWAVESLHYLEAVDVHVFSGDAIYPLGWDSQIVDLAHARWASGTAMTALDLCAAVIARRQRIPPRRAGEEADIGTLRRQRATLTTSQASWLGAVDSDRDYLAIEEVRHALIHRRLPRTVYATSAAAAAADPRPGHLRERTDLAIAGGTIPTRAVIERSRVMSQRLVDAFLRLVETGQL